jgi:putative modified peptide
MQDVAITARQARSIIESLANDDDFRGLMTTDPVRAFARFNVTLPSKVPFPAIALPSKQALQSALKDLKGGKSWSEAVGTPHEEDAYYAFVAFFAFAAAA